jgi:hypothetical protein
MASNALKIIYVSREIERALGTAPGENYQIVSNETPYGLTVKKQYPDFITLVKSPKAELLGTTDLLNRPETSKLLRDDSRLLVFKNTLRVETAANSNHWKLLNPPANISERVENKLSQIRWLGTVGQRYLPPHAAKVAKFITWKSEAPFIIQWAHGHTGDGTILIRKPEDLRAIQEKFPERMARITNFVDGPSFTVNVVVTPERLLMGNVSYQITGLSPFTDNEFSTIGNDWGAARSLLSAGDFQTIQSMTAEIGQKMQADSWKGLFGIDFIREEKSKRMYLIEVNARQPASATFESTLQEQARARGVRGLTTFEAHIRALLGLPIDQDLIAIDDGAQIIQRVTKNVQSIFDDAAKDLQKKGYAVVSYQNSTPNSDLLRIQSPAGIMEGHRSFNLKGKEIAEAIKSAHFKIEV